MTLRDASDLYAYTEWANARTFACAETLDAEAWSRDLGGSFPSLGATLAHMVGAEWIWLQRWLGRRPSGRPAWADAPTPGGLRAALDAVQAERGAFLRGLHDADLVRPCAYTLLSGAAQEQPLAVLLVHVANHATYHRGQAAAMLRRLGATPPPTDALVFAMKHVAGARGDSDDEGLRREGGARRA